VGITPFDKSSSIIGSILILTVEIFLFSMKFLIKVSTVMFIGSFINSAGLNSI